MSRTPERDPLVTEFGVASVDDWVGDDRSRRHVDDLSALAAKVNQLPALGDRPEITTDFMTDDPVFKEFQGEWGGPTISEQQARFSEWSNFLSDVHTRAEGDAPPARSREPQRRSQTTDTDIDPSELASTMEREFTERFGKQDAAELEAAASRVAERDGLDLNRREDFYASVARELGIEKPAAKRTRQRAEPEPDDDADGRTEMVTRIGTTLERIDARERGERDDMISDLHRTQLKEGFF